MTTADGVRPDPAALATGTGPPRPEHDDDPWEGIPAEVLDAAAPYDADTTGGCG